MDVPLERIRHLRETSADTPLMVWSIQHRLAIDELERGQLVASYHRVKHERLPATRWMADEMRRRGLELGTDDSPMWLFLEEPPLRNDAVWGNPPSHGADHRLLNLLIPLKRMLISYHWPWANTFLHEFRPNPVRFYLSSSQVERESLGFPIPPEAECQRSWQRLFDLTLVDETGFSWEDSRSAGGPSPLSDFFRLQATVPCLLRSDLISVSNEW